MKRLCGALLILMSLASTALAKEETAKFYDFSDQLIDGEIKKPTALYTDSRMEVRFTRLLSLKKTFLPVLLQTSKERVFK